jgi:hypothetical protein
MESGLARARRRFPRAPSHVSASWLMTGPQLRYFHAWVEQRAGYGAAWFKIALDFGLGAQEVTARLMEAPRITRQTRRRWRVDLRLEVLPLEIEALDELEYISIAGGFGALEAAADMARAGARANMGEAGAGEVLWHEKFPA